MLIGESPAFLEVVSNLAHRPYDTTILISGGLEPARVCAQAIHRLNARADHPSSRSIAAPFPLN
jgi:hypothetical protein